ncbi:MAG: hypothetical protein LUE99_13900 [Bacteroides sp.]|nr:hypothetical protein [Bacteroides sp.]
MIRLFGKLTLVTCCILLVMMPCASCNDDGTNEIIDDGSVMITLHLSLPGTDEDTGSDEHVETRAISAEIEKKLDVTQLKVLVFKANGSTETFAYEAPQITFKSDNTYTVTLRKVCREKFIGWLSLPMQAPNCLLFRKIQVKVML